MGPNILHLLSETKFYIEGRGDKHFMLDVVAAFIILMLTKICM